MFDAICTLGGSPHDDKRKVLAKSGQEVFFGFGDGFGSHDGVEWSGNVGASK
jgi:hypothetical protein